MSDTLTTAETTTETNGASATSGAPLSFAAIRAELETQPSPLAEAPSDAPAAETDATPDADAPLPEGYTRDADGRLRGPDGKFAADPTPPAPEGAPVEGEAAPAEETEPQPEPIRLTLPGLPERGEEALELEVTDPQVAERIQRALKEGMRRDEYTKRMEAVRAEQAELREFQALLTDTPEYVVAQLPPDAKARVVEALLPEVWETLLPQLEHYAQDPRNLAVALAEQRAQVAARQQAAETRMQLERAAMQIEAAVVSLVPETVDDATRMLFLRDAEADLRAEAARNPRLGAADVPAVLARRLQLYGWTPDQSGQATGVPGTAPATPAPPRVATARPVSAPAARAPQVPAPVAKSPTPARAQQVLDARARAAVLPAAGAGATVTPAQPPAWATQSIEGMSKWLRQQAGAQ